ncbi:hypothetical protein [Pseudofrankia inefficax]|uniref:Uncharacterized protein n=1 Tax=Pseudofrankia inefficax (strain DSM 45817 / CECT 9037 / DDB 130130 / EuI1c) TaxID=298654 RepID=E3J406_PSEI1|nr:hypothetical protein [Pseudofrankia inefficax]ADP80639.1 hypothetical protein FraEuI1c_2606 [Pseudofrankia inefficax]
MTRPGVCPAGAATVVVFLLYLLVYLLVLLGMLLLGGSLWPSRAVSWWQAALVGVGALLGFAGPEGPSARGSPFRSPSGWLWPPAGSRGRRTAEARTSR